MSHKENIKRNMVHMNTSLADWVFSDVVQGTCAPSLYIGGGSCEGTFTCQLCGKSNCKEPFYTYNSKMNWYLVVGSECIRKFDSSEGKSGKEIKKENLVKEARQFTSDLFIKLCFSGIRTLSNFAYDSNSQDFNNYLYSVVAYSGLANEKKGSIEYLFASYVAGCGWESDTKTINIYNKIKKVYVS